MAEKLGIETPTIDEILNWAQLVRCEKIVDDNNNLISDSPDLTQKFKTGIPSVYGFKTIEECID